MQRNWIGRSTGAEVRVRRSRAGTSRSPCSPPGRTRCTARRSSWSPPTRRWPRRSARRSSARRCRGYLTQVRKLTDIERQSADRPKTGVFLGVHAVNPVNGERIPVWAADYVLPDYGTGAIMAVPAHDQRDLDFARTFGLPVRVVVDTGEPDPAETGIATPGDGMLVNSGPLDGLAKAEAIARITEILAGRGPGQGGGQLPAARLAAVPAAVLGHARSRSSTARPAARCRCPTTSCRCVLPDLRGAGPGAQGRLAAGRRDGLGRTPSAPSAAARPGATPTRWTPSSTRPGTSCGTARPATSDGPFDVEAVRRWAPGRPVRGRRRARHPAPAVHPVLHQGAARHGHGRLRRAVHPAAEPGPGDQPGQGDVASRWATASTWASSWPRTASTPSG